MVAELSAGAVIVGDEDKDWETLLLAFRRSGIALVDLIRAIRNKRLTVGQRAGVTGFHGIVVPKSEVDVLAAPFLSARNQVIGEVPGNIAVAEFGRSVGLRDGGVFEALIEAGHVSAYRIINPWTGRPQYRMTPENVTAFHQRFVTLTTLSAETGQHRNTLKGILTSRGIAPFSSEGQSFGAVYLRGDLVEILGSK